MYELKPLSPDSLSTALEKAQRYRLLNEPLEAESICRDILAVDPAHQEALVTLLLALTDQFEERLFPCFDQAQEVLAALDDEYSRTYHKGIVCERRAKAQFKRGGQRAGSVAYDWFRQALECFEQAAEVRPRGNDDAILRWNTCVRILNAHRELAPEPEESTRTWLE
jgi:hypothetical protein